MVQVGHALDLSNRKWEDIPSLKKDLRAAKKGTIREYIRRISQTTTAGAVDVEELSGETLTAMSASKVLEVWQKTDQVGTDGGAAVVIEWQDVLGNVTEATSKLNAIATTTHTVLTATVATARAIRAFSLAALLAADEVLLGNHAGNEVFAVIKVGHYQCLKSKYMVATNRDSYLGKISLDLDAASAAIVTLTITYTPYGHVSSTTATLILAAGSTHAEWEPCLKLKAASVVSMTVIDNNAAHPIAIVTPYYIEAY